MEFIWKGIGFGATEGVFTHVLNSTYFVPWFLDIDEAYPESRCFEVPLLPGDLERW